MGREVRMVPEGWQHPTELADGKPRYVALYDGSFLKGSQEDWDEEAAKWAAGEFPSYASEESKNMPYEEWAGSRPDPKDYMPVWDDAERTHFMMYEDTSEGTPISPAFSTAEQLAHWLADTGASAFGSSTATYEQWLRVCKGAWAPSLVVDSKGLRSGIEFLDDSES